MRNSDFYGYIVNELHGLALECESDAEKVSFILALCDLLKEIGSLVELPPGKVQLFRHLVALMDPMPEPPSEVPV